MIKRSSLILSGLLISQAVSAEEAAAPAAPVDGWKVSERKLVARFGISRADYGYNSDVSNQANGPTFEMQVRDTYVNNWSAAWGFGISSFNPSGNESSSKPSLNLTTANFDVAYKVWAFRLGLGGHIGVAEYSTANDYLLTLGSRAVLDCELPWGLMLTGNAGFYALGRQGLSLNAGLGLGYRY